MQKFINSKEYKTMKKKYELEYFKLGGSYAWYDGDKIINKPANIMAEYFKNKKVTITEESENDDGETIQKKKSKAFYQVWSEDPNMKEYKEVVFECDEKLVRDSQFNMFNGCGSHLSHIKHEMFNLYTVTGNKLSQIKHDKNVRDLETFLEPIFDHMRSL